jgi:hypothetical protein
MTAEITSYFDFSPPASTSFVDLGENIFSTNRFMEALIQNLGATSSQVSQRTKIDRLIQAYRDEELVLVLGAGVSMPYGLPDWNTLLQKLLLTTMSAEAEKSPERAELLARLYSTVFAPNPLIAARYLNDHYRKNDTTGLAFETAIRDALYEFVTGEHYTELFKEVRQLCIAPGRSPSLDSIITYNYDDLLERCLADIDVEIRHRPVYAVGMNPGPGELPLYHVHGFLPREEALTDAHRVALSDDQYHKQYADVYSWNNMVQLNKFRDSTCLFIGTSITDPNLRRLLDIARLQRGDTNVRHYVIRKHYDSAELQERLRKLLEENTDILDKKRAAELPLDETAERLREIAETFEENDARSFGVETLWVDTFDEIPAILRQIRRMQLDSPSARRDVRRPIARRKSRKL